MKKESIDRAVAEAKRFLERFEELKKRPTTYVSCGNTYFLTSPKESGALRRASLDLTRALAEMRKP